MKKINIIFLKFSVLFLIGILSCDKKALYINNSRATGWKTSGLKQSFAQKTGPGLVFIEGGSFMMGKVEDDVMYDWNNGATNQHVMSFYMDETEVTNAMYLEYLRWTKKIFPPTEEKYKNIYSGILPDTLVWRNRLGYSEVMVDNYLRHPAYSNYPVVGVNWVQATEFCIWRTDRVNELALEKNGFIKKGAKDFDVSAGTSFSSETYFAAPTLTYSGNADILLNEDMLLKDNRKSKEQERNIYPQRASGMLLLQYRLPTEAEWEYAAAADVGQRVYNNYKGQRKYPWSGKYTMSKEGTHLANFKQSAGDYGGVTDWSNDGADLTNAVRSYPANSFGLYDMSGNVAEWVADVYRPTIDNETNDFNYYRGNEFVKNKLGKDRKVELYNEDNMVYDTLSNGRIIARSFPGQIVTVPVDEQETFLRRNFDKPYAVNYKDGDEQSIQYLKSRYAGFKKGKNSKEMYHSPNNAVSIDSSGNKVVKYDKSSKRTTLISDKTRVYKGGSWRDREYWLNPAQRRFLSQDMATSFIGFRCAMSRVGLKAVRKKTKRN